MQNLMPPVNTPDNLFHNGDPRNGEEGTIVTAEFLNDVQSSIRGTQAEIISVLAASGIEVDPDKSDQLLTAIQALASGATPSKLVISVNGETGEVILSASDVGAVPMNEDGSVDAITQLKTTEQVIPGDYSNFDERYLNLPSGTVKEAVRYVTPEMFLVTGDYASDSAAINACAEYARANGLSVLGSAVYTVTEDIQLTGVSWRGGTFKGTGEEKIICVDSEIERVEFDSAYLHIMGGKCRITRNEFHGQTSTAALFIQGMTSQGQIEVSNNEFHHCNFAILQQGTGEIMLSGRYKDNYIHDIYGDGIELNVVNGHYPQGLVIEGNIVDNVDSALSNEDSTPNWGIGIGIAGKGPYGIDIDDGMYVSGFTIRGNKITGCRQCIHTEICRDFVLVDNECHPDVSKSADAGLYLAAYASYGCKSFTIDGMSGEPVGNAKRFILLDWGVNSGVYDAPPRDFVVRNVTTQTGDIDIATAGANNWTNSTILENIRCNILQWRGLPPVSVFRNIFCNTLDCIGQHAFGEGSGGGTYSRSHYTYTNWSNVICLNDVYSSVSISKMFVERCDQSGNNFIVPLAEDASGHRGARLFRVVEQYLLEDDVFPGGRYFEKGTVLWKASGAGGFKVTVAGTYIKTSGTTTDKIKATAVGDTFIRANGIAWADGQGAKTSGTRLRIPGAGAGGADLITTIIRSPYVVDSVWTVDIAPPIATATAENIQIFAAEPVEYVEF